MNLRRRLGLIALMGLSLITCAMSIMKGVSAIPAPSGNDATYTATLSLLWATLEQAFVILLGNVAPLRPIAKLHIPLLSTLAESMSSLLGRNSRNTSKATSGRMPGYANGAYQSMEMDTHKLGINSNDVWHEVKSSSSSHDTRTGGTIPDGQVKRTDAFTIVYDQSDALPHRN